MGPPGFGSRHMPGGWWKVPFCCQKANSLSQQIAYLDPGWEICSTGAGDTWQCWLLPLLSALPWKSEQYLVFLGSCLHLSRTSSSQGGLYLGQIYISWIATFQHPVMPDKPFWWNSFLCLGFLETFPSPERRKTFLCPISSQELERLHCVERAWYWNQT